MFYSSSIGSTNIGEQEQNLEDTIMAWVGILIMLVGVFVSFVAGISLLIAIYKKSGVLWLAGSFFFPIVSLVWICMNWEEGKSPFLKSLLGSGLCIVGSVVSAAFAS
jgi:hypothetical protein